MVGAWADSFDVPSVSDARRRGAVKSASIPFFLKQSGICLSGSLLLSFLNRYAFAEQKRFLLRTLRRSLKHTRRYKRTSLIKTKSARAERFLPKSLAVRPNRKRFEANTLYPVLTALCSLQPFTSARKRDGGSLARRWHPCRGRLNYSQKP